MLGMTQLLFEDVPAHAAVDTAVGLADTRMKGLVNAVLRRGAREGPALVEEQDAARLNTPPRLWAGWETAYGEAAARAIAEAHLREAPLDLTLRRPEAPGPLPEGETMPTGSLRIARPGAIGRMPGYEDGGWWVQDMAAALPVRMLGPVAGERVLDLCAAPGGKTAAVAAAGAVRQAWTARRIGWTRRAPSLARSASKRSGSRQTPPTGVPTTRSRRCCWTRPAAPPARSAGIPTSCTAAPDAGWTG